MAATLELVSQLTEVVDLAVENDPDHLLGIRHRLMAAGEIDDREAPEPEAERAGEEVPFVIGPAVRDRPCHGLDVHTSDRSAAREVELSADPAHDSVHR